MIGRPMTDKDRAACEECLRLMKVTCDSYYYQAVRIGHHQFIEFSGIIGEYINVCRDALDAGIDFRNMDVEPKPWQAKYIAEKLGCIFDGRLRVVAPEAEAKP